jgi:hypothetical protein
MAKRQDSGSNPSPEPDRRPHDEDRLPEFTDPTRGRSDEDEFEDLGDETEVEEVDEEDGSF